MSVLNGNPEWLARRRKLILKGGQFGGTRVSDMQRYKPKKQKFDTSVECISCNELITIKEKKEGKIIPLANGNWIHERCV